MSLDLSLTHLYLNSLGTTIENLLSLANLIVYNRDALSFDNVMHYINLLHIWPTHSDTLATIDNVLFIVYSNDNYIDTVKEVLTYAPYLQAMDYLHLFYIKQVVYKCYLAMYSNSAAALIKPVVISLQLDIIFSALLNKWAYAIFSFGVAFVLSHVIRFRYQYGFNFYFNYFKTVSDLGEQEYGSYDDFKFFLFLLIQMFIWYCWVLFVGYTFSLQFESRLVLLTVSIMITILTIPVRLLWDFGLSFGMYVRGAASSSNLIVEAFFDIIGVIIIFTRFVVQNIRFLLVFVAFFELFEWVSSSSEVAYILKFNADMLEDMSFFTTLEPKSIFMYVILSVKTMFIYLYHLLHLIVVSFMQIGVYLMVSFWLFFFLYTSFFKLTTDSYFSVVRNSNVC